MLKPKAAKITIGTFVERYRASDFFSHAEAELEREAAFGRHAI
jgi:hypothetical protein